MTQLTQEHFDKQIKKLATKEACYSTQACPSLTTAAQSAATLQLPLKIKAASSDLRSPTFVDQQPCALASTSVKYPNQIFVLERGPPSPMPDRPHNKALRAPLDLATSAPVLSIGRRSGELLRGNRLTGLQLQSHFAICRQIPNPVPGNRQFLPLI